MLHAARLGLVPLALAACLPFSTNVSATSSNYLNNPGFEGTPADVSRCDGRNAGKIALNWDENSSCDGIGYSVRYDQGGNRPPVAPATVPSGSYSQVLTLQGPVPEARLKGFNWLFAGQKYTASIWLKADGPREVQLSLRRDGWPYTEYGVLVAKVDTQWRQYTFKGLAPNDPSGKTGAWLNVVVNQPGSVWLDDASVVSDDDTVGDPPAPTTAVPRTFFGLHVLRDTDQAGRKVGAFMDKSVGFMRLWDAGASRLNTQENGPGSYDWTGFNDRVKLARDHNAEPLMVLGGLIPLWAAAPADRTQCNFYGATNTSSPPSDIEVWKTWVRAVAVQAKGKVRYFEIWNEPYMCPGFKDRLPFLAQMEIEAVRILKEVDPTNVVLSPSMPPWGNDFIDRYLQAGGGRTIDALSVHLYDNYLADHLDSSKPYALGELASVENLLVRDRYMGNLRLVLERAGLANLPVWDTESGYSARNATCTLQNQDKAIPYIARHYLLSWLVGIQRSAYYAWDLRFQPHPSNTCYTPVALGREAAEAQNLPYEVTPAGKAYEQIAKWMTGAVLSAPQFVGSGEQKIWVVKLKRGPTTSYVAWNPTWVAGAPNLPTYTPPSPKLSTRTTLAGAVNYVSGATAINASPVLFAAPNTYVEMTTLKATFWKGWNLATTLTATVTGGSAPTGYVQFKIDGNNLGAPVALVNGVATLRTSDIDDYPVAWHVLTATYLGDEFNATALSPAAPVQVCTFGGNCP